LTKGLLAWQAPLAGRLETSVNRVERRADLRVLTDDGPILFRGQANDMPNLVGLNQLMTSSKHEMNHDWPKLGACKLCMPKDGIPGRQVLEDRGKAKPKPQHAPQHNTS
jgi:hypothetical protein